MTTYIDSDFIRNNSQSKNLVEESDDILNPLIERAERFIDSVSGYWMKYDPDQTRLFPRQNDIDTDGNTFIHDTVKEATLIQVEFLYNQTPDDEHGIKSEDGKDRFQVISPRMKELLRGSGLTRRTGKIVFN